MRKDADVKVSTLRDELQEVTSARDELERNLAERKRKMTEEREKLEREAVEMKAKYEVLSVRRSES